MSEEKIGKNLEMTPEKEMEILRKIEKLMKLQAMLKDPRLKVEDFDEDELEALLTKAELFEEALKNYMYQFGLSLYQNKEGKSFFKKFMDDYDDLRDAGELDRHNFSPKSREPNWLEKIMEHTPENKIFLNNPNVEKVVLELCERDNSMLDVLEKIVATETEICGNIYKNRQMTKNANNAPEPELVNVDEKIVPEKEELKELPEQKVVLEEVEMSDVEDEWQESYECGENKSQLSSLPRVKKVRRLNEPPKQEKPLNQFKTVVKENINNR